MKKKKLVLAVAGLLCCTTLFSACGTKKASLDMIYNADWKAEETKLTSAAEKLEYTNIDEISDFGEYYAIFTKDDTTACVYNFKAGKEIVTKDFKEGESEWDITDQIDVFGFHPFVLENVKTTTDEDSNIIEEKTVSYFYDENGKELASADGEQELAVSLDLIRFNGVTYRINPTDGTIEKAFDSKGIASLPEFDYKVGDYYVSDTNVYDKELNLLVSYTFPTHTRTFAFALLTDGKLLIQYATYSNNNEIKYEFEYYGNYYNLHTMIMDVNTGKTKNLNVDYIYYEVSAANQLTSEGAEYLDLFKIDNYCSIFPIVDKHIDDSDSALTYHALSSDGKLGADLLSGFFNGTVKELPRRLTADRYVFVTMDDRDYLVNEKGETIGEVTGCYYDSERNGFYDQSVFYDMDLNVVYDSSKLGDEQNYMSKYYSDYITIFERNDGESAYLLTKNGELKEIFSEKDNYEDKEAKMRYSAKLWGCYNCFYTVKRTVQDNNVFTTTNSYECYGQNGELLFTSENEIKIVNATADMDDYTILKTTVTVDTTPTTVYYCVHK